MSGLPLQVKANLLVSQETLEDTTPSQQGCGKLLSFCDNRRCVVKAPRSSCWSCSVKFLLSHRERPPRSSTHSNIIWPAQWAFDIVVHFSWEMQICCLNWRADTAWHTVLFPCPYYEWYSHCLIVYKIQSSLRTASSQQKIKNNNLTYINTGTGDLLFWWWCIGGFNKFSTCLCLYV